MGSIDYSQHSIFADPNSEPNKPLMAKRSRFTFQHNWFDEEVRPDWERGFVHLRDKKLCVLELGAFEGASTTWLLDNLMSHPESTMTTVDTFEGGSEHQDPDQAHKYDLTTLERRFRSNVSQCKHSKKLTIMKTTSGKALLSLLQKDAVFDFIYIDASHTAIDVMQDAVLCWRMLRLNGILVFDDINWKGYMEDCYNPRIAIKSFLACVAPETMTEEAREQIWVTKVPRKFLGTPNSDRELRYYNKFDL